jgi:hypothetical protein
MVRKCGRAEGRPLLSVARNKSSEDDLIGMERREVAGIFVRYLSG